MAESFQEKRKRELGLNADSPTTDLVPTSFQDRRKIELGISPNPQQTQIDEAAQIDNYYKQIGSAPAAIERQRPGRDLPVIGPVLRGLDAFSENPVVDAGASFMRSVYTPGAGIGNIGAMTGVVERGLGRLAPGLGSTFGGRVAQEAIKEGTVGVPLGAGQSLASGNPDFMDAGKAGLIGGALGSVGGAAFPLIGRGIQAAESVAARGLGQAVERPSLGAAVNEFTRNVDNSRVPSYNASEPLEFPTLTQNPAGRGVLRASSRVDIPEQSSRGSVADAVSTPPTQRARAPQALYDQYDALRDEYSSINQQLHDYQQELLTKYDKTDSLADAPLTPAEGRKHSDLWKILRNVDNKGKEAYQAIINAEKELQAPVKIAEPPQPPAERPRLSGTLSNVGESLNVSRIKPKEPTNLDELVRSRGYGEATPSIEKVRFNVKDKALNAGQAPVPKLIKLSEQKALNASQEPNSINPSGQGITPLSATNMKDLSGFQAYTTDVYRNFENVMGKESADKFLAPFNQAKKDNIAMQEELLTKLKTEVVDKLGIHKGSKLSGLVQKYGEKQIDLEQLKSAAPNDWQEVVKADQWFRNAYDTIINDVNATRAKVYPNNPDKQIPKRNDYYRHFQEFEGLAGLKNLFDTPSAIDPSLAGISEFVTPKSKWASFMQKRGMGPFKNDAVGGFLNYIPAASYSTHIDPQISRFRDLEKTLVEGTQDTRHLNDFIGYLNDYANDLAGKTNPADRFIQKIIPGGRKAMAALQWVNNRVKANTILGNVGSTLSQLANIPNGIAFAKQYAAKGAGETLASAFGKNTTPMKESGFLKERYAGAMYRQFNTKLIDKPRYVAEWMMETSDRIGTSFIWNSAYAKGVAEKVSNPIAYADDTARKLVAGRGIGEVPILQKSKIVQLVAPFQLEVANLWRVQKDFVKENDFTALAVLFAGNYLFNRGMEQVRGSGVTFDPIQAMVEASAPDLTPIQRGGRLAGEVLSNVPLGQTLAGMYPEFGGNVMGMDLPTRKKLFGDNDPTRFGGGLLAIKGAQDPLYKLALPFGGNQLKKTIQGTDAISKDGSYDNKGQLKFPIEPTATNIARMGLFGPTATPEGRDFYKNDRRPLSLDQTKAYENSADKPAIYKTILKQREINNIESSIVKVSKDKALSDSEKIKKITELQGKLQKSVGR